jgi:hypothetical protein
LEIEFEVNEVMVPTACPLIDAVSRRGTETSVLLLAVPVPAVMLTVTKPTGSVVAFWALAVGRAARRAAAKEGIAIFSFIMLVKVEGSPSRLQGNFPNSLDRDGAGVFKVSGDLFSASKS